MKVVTLYYDSDIANPTEWDGQWQLYSFNRRHNAYEDPERFFPNGHPTIGLRRKLDVGLAFTLSYTEHGNCRWFRGGEERSGRRGDYDFDTVRFAGLLIWEHPPRDLGAQTLEERQRDADQFLETYTAWANGDGYGFMVEDVDANGERTEITSTFGFYGNDLEYMASQIREAVGDDQDVEVEGEAAGVASYMRLTNPPVGPPHGPWTPREGLRYGTMDETEVAVWSDYVSEAGAEELGINNLSADELNELRALRLKLKMKL